MKYMEKERKPQEEREQKVTYNGVLHFHSETGTEGGYWAFQDEKFIDLPDPHNYSCTGCGRCWNKSKTTEEPKPSFAYWIERDENDRSPEGYRYASGYMSYDAPRNDLPEAPPYDDKNSFNYKFIHTGNERARDCYENGHKGWKLINPNGTWSYEGLHVLKDGDELTIYSKKNKEKVLWEGEISLKQHNLFTEHTSRLWIHADQKGINRETWANYFFKEYPAKLVTLEKPRKK